MRSVRLSLLVPALAVAALAMPSPPAQAQADDGLARRLRQIQGVAADSVEVACAGLAQRRPLWTR